MAIRYIVNEENRVVVAVIDDCKYDAVRAANAWTGYNCWRACYDKVEISINNNKKYFIPNKFVGVAKCSTEDEWNEQIGKNLARDRVLDKYHKSLNKALRKINSDIALNAARFNERVQKLRDTK